ncbi:MAG TPA: hypothetical protein VGE52_03645 [Pirellulales bacterium]
MRRRVLGIALLGWLVAASPVMAGLLYTITSHDGDKVVTYEVTFGGGRLSETYTAFDPESKKFVYLSFPRKGEAPKPVATIWDHRTGEMIPLYKFPEAKHPLPVIPSIDEMKVCPLTNDKNFSAEPKIAFD